MFHQLAFAFSPMDLLRFQISRILKNFLDLDFSWDYMFHKSVSKVSEFSMLLGYARVSSDGQSLDSQVAQLTAAGCHRVFQEKIGGGSRSNRTELARALRKLVQGDVLLVCRLDRLARSSCDLLNILHEVGEKGASFRSMGELSADTTSAHGRLLISILGGLAEFEKELIAARTATGRAQAKKDGIRFGRPRALNAFQRKEAIKRRENGETLKAIARSYRSLGTDNFPTSSVLLEALPLLVLTTPTELP